MRLSSDSLWLLGSAVAAICAAPLIVHGDPSTTTHREQARQALAMLTPAERERVEENFERYRTLPPENRLAVRQLHEELTEDAGGAAAKTLDIYATWIRELSPFQLEELRREPDVERRIALIKQIEDERTAQASRSPGGWWRWARISTEEFYALMDLLEKRASSDLSTEDYVEIHKVAAATPRRALAVVERLRAQGRTFNELVNEATFEEMADLIRDRDAVERPEQPGRRGGNQERGERRPFSERLQFLRNQMFRKMSYLLFQDGIRNQPTDQDLISQLDDVSETEQATYYALSADQLKQLLRFDVIMDRGNNHKKLLHEFFEPDFQRPGRGGPQGGNRSRRDNESRESEQRD